MENGMNFVRVSLPADNMSATVTILPTAEPGSVTDQDVLSVLRNQKITYGIDEDLIKAIVDDHSKYGLPFVVAKGVMPVEGANGYYDFKFDISNEARKPSVLKDGSTDYYNIRVFQNVKQDDILCEYIPKIVGENGMTVLGTPVKAAVTRDLPALRGSGFYAEYVRKFTGKDTDLETFNPKDGEKKAAPKADDASQDLEEGKVLPGRVKMGIRTLYKAAIDGKPEFKYGNLNVLAVCEIQGDVDLSVGNVNYHGDIQINGNVTSGFVVNATGNVVVNGMVEGAIIKAGKTIQVKDGVVGNNKASLEAGEDVIASFAENAFITAGRDVTANSLINCQVEAGRIVIVQGKIGTVIGGTIVANTLIQADNIGSLGGIKTHLRVGCDATVLNELNSLTKDLAKAEQELSKIELAISMMEEKKIDNASLKMQLLHTKIDKAAYIYKYREITDRIRKNIISGQDAKVIAVKAIYPGAIITINVQSVYIDSEYSDIIFFNKDHKILSKKLDVDVHV